MDRDNIPGYLAAVLERFEGVRPTRGGWDALCPRPDHNRDGDQRPSLHIALGQDGRVLITCRVGCPTDAVLDAVGLTWRELFRPDDDADLLNDPAPFPTATPAACVDVGLRH